MVDYKLREREMMQYVTTLVKEQKNSYSAIVLSGMQVIPLAPKLKKVSLESKIIADLHGAFEELIEFPGNSFVKTYLRKIYYNIAKKNERNYLKICSCFISFSWDLVEFLTISSLIDKTHRLLIEFFNNKYIYHNEKETIICYFRR